MCLKNKNTHYGLIAQAFHWGMALLIFAMLGIGFYMETLDRGPELFKMIGLHKSLGILVFILLALRILWRFVNVTPKALPHYKKLEIILSKAIQGILYLSMLMMPLSGWIMSSSGGYPVKFFNLVTLPAIVEKSKALHERAEMMHWVIAWVLIAALVLHVAGALKHHIIDKDDTIKRMLPWGMKSKEQKTN